MKRMPIAVLWVTLLAALALPSACSSGSPRAGAACEGTAGSYIAQFRSSCISFGLDAVVLNQSGCHLVGSTSSAMIEGDLNVDTAVFWITFLGASPGTVTGSVTFVGNTASGTFQGRPSPGSNCCNGEMSGTFTLNR